MQKKKNTQEVGKKLFTALFLIIINAENRPSSTGVLEGAKHPQTKSKAPSVKAV